MKFNKDKFLEDYSKIQEYYNKLQFDDIEYIIEFSYILGTLEEKIKRLNDFIMLSISGIDTYNVFVIYLYKKFTKESNVDYIEYITHNIKEIIDDFIKKYQ